jgi:hypothetical protein
LVELETAQILRVAVSGDRPTKAANARTLQMWSLRVFSLKPRTLMSSIMRARSALTGRSEGWEVIGGSSLKPKVVGPSMLGIGCPGGHALALIFSPSPPRSCWAAMFVIPREQVRSWGITRRCF